MADYTIRVMNQAGAPKDYGIFSKPPKVTKSGADHEVFSNVWVTFEGIKDGGHDTLIYHDETFAYWGHLPAALDPNTIVESGGQIEVDTETKDGVTFSAAPDDIGFDPTIKKGVANEGAFQIVASNNFTIKDHFVLGMAKSDGTPIAAPVATFTAEPGDTFEVIPVVVFYVSEGKFTQGKVIDVKEHSTRAAKIDFTGRRETMATVVQDAHGDYSVSYS